MKKLWQYFSGKKRNIGIILMLIGGGLKVFNIIPGEQAQFIETIGLTIGGAGLVHSVGKDKKTMDSINSAIKKVTKK